MSISWISLPALLAVHLGFAALLGAVSGTARQTRWQFPTYCAVGLGSLLFLGANLALPLPMWANSLVWMTSAGAFGLGFESAELLRGRVEFGWYYAGTAMILILIWGMAQGFSPPTLVIGLAAALAAGISLRRGLLAKFS
jgi:hypothetical protein